MDQSLMVRSSEQEAIILELIGENSISDIPFVWPISSASNSPLLKLNTLTVVSDDPVANLVPSGDILIEFIECSLLLIEYFSSYKSSIGYIYCATPLSFNNFCLFKDDSAIS